MGIGIVVWKRKLRSKKRV